MALDLTQVLDKKIEDIERPPLVPACTYDVARVDKQPVLREVNDDWEALDFLMAPVSADMDTISQEELDEFGDITKARVRHTFMFDKNDNAAFERTLFNVRRFLEDHLGIADGDTTLKEALNAAVGATCGMTIEHRQDKQNPELYHANVKATFPI